MQATECTLYSGGHIGAESLFGECAEKYGVKEVTFTFDGHYLKREKSLVKLTREELLRGDVSMEIISTHMGRTYPHPESMKAVFQSLFHMVNKGLQVFAVGTIQDNNTVRGGTGWAVELGKLFNRDTHVFDQGKNAWFTWRHGEWLQDLPVITEKTFCGTGTRELSDDSRKAVEALFARSFGKS